MSEMSCGLHQGSLQSKLDRTICARVLVRRPSGTKRTEELLFGSLARSFNLAYPVLPKKLCGIIYLLGRGA